MYKVSITLGEDLVNESPLTVASLKDLDSAIAYAFQLHNMSNVPHFIIVGGPSSNVASFTRLEEVPFPDKVNK